MKTLTLFSLAFMMLFMSLPAMGQDVDPDAWKKDGRFAVYFGPGVASNIDQDAIDTEDRNVFIVDLGLLYEITRNFGLGLEMGHNSEDWSISRTQMVGIIRLAPNAQSGFATYIKISGGALTWDTSTEEEDKQDTEFVWNLEPSFGLTWKPAVEDPFSFFLSTGPSLIFGASQETVAAVQSRVGLAIEFGGE